MHFTLTQEPPLYGSIKYDPLNTFAGYASCDKKGFMEYPHPAVYDTTELWMPFFDEETEWMFEGMIKKLDNGVKVGLLWWNETVKNPFH